MKPSKITQERMEQALDFLSETDEVVAGLKADMLRAEYVLKRKEAAAFLSAEGKTAVLRQNLAKVDDDVVAAYDAHTDAMEQYETIAAKRKTEALIVDVFRTVEASRRQGS